MKALIVLSLSVFSLNLFAAEVGESLSADKCIYTNQSASRDPKVVASSSTDKEKKEPVKSVSK